MIARSTRAKLSERLSETLQRVQIQSLTDLVVGQFRTTLYIMLAAVGLLLLIGCGNVANLIAGARDRPGKGICHPRGAGRRPRGD